MSVRVVMVLYAVGMIAGGVYAFTSAPPEANRATALVIPGAIATLMLLLAWFIGLGRGARRVGVVLGVVIALGSAFAVGSAASKRGEQLGNYPAALEAFRVLEAQGSAPAGDQRRAFFRERQSPDHDTGYLVTTLWALIGVSVLAEIGMVIASLFARQDPTGTPPAQPAAV